MNFDLRTAGRALRLTLSLLFISTLFIGCSSQGNSITPGQELTSEQARDESSQTENRYLWGCWEGNLDREKNEITMTPLRVAGTHFNLVQLLNTSGGLVPEVILNDSIPGDGIYSVRITIFNPYSYDPKFVGFDVRGIFITPSTKPVGLGLWTASENEPRLLNADGFTRWWNPAEFTTPGLMGYINGNMGSPNTGNLNARLNGYKIFADALPNEQELDLGYIALPGLAEANGRSVFRSTHLARRYEIQFPAGSNRFNYAVDASWAPPYVNPPQVPGSFPPAANCNEAWYIRTDITNNTLEYNPSNGTHTGGLSLYVTVYDWQGRINGANATQISSVKIHSWDLMGFNSVNANLIYDGADVAMYSVDLTPNVEPTFAGNNMLAVEVVSAFGKYKQSYQNAPSTPLAAYTIIPIDVKNATISGPELIKTFGIRAYVLRQDGGVNPSISEADILEDIAWASDFWGQYGFKFQLAKTTYIDSSYWYNVGFDNAPNLYQQYHDVSGLINVYYFHDIIGFGGAYASLFCDDTYQRGIYTYVMFDATDCAGWEEVLSHELGHVIGMLDDEYLLDEQYGNCTNLLMATCGTTNTDTFCSNSDNVYGNLMWYLKSTPGHPPADYFLSDTDVEMQTSQIDSQAEHAAHFHTVKPYNFKSM